MASKALNRFNSRALWSYTSSLAGVRLARSCTHPFHLRQPIVNSVINTTCRANISSISKSPQRFPFCASSPSTSKFFTHFRLPRLRHRGRFNTTTTTTTTSIATPASDANLTLGQRMKKLSKEYGYSALAVYLGLSVLDFPFCFLLVRYVGSDTIAKYEHAIIEWFWSIVPDQLYHRVPSPSADIDATLEEKAETIKVRDADGKIDGAQKAKKQVSIWTELALAYAVHKSLIFFRVPLTAAVTPKIVKKLRSWGFNIGIKGGIREGAKKTFPKTEARFQRAGKRMEAKAKA